MVQCPLGQRLKVVLVTIVSKKSSWHIEGTQIHVFGLINE